jgi:hypothetical protein
MRLYLSEMIREDQHDLYKCLLIGKVSCIVPTIWDELRINITDIGGQSQHSGEIIRHSIYVAKELDDYSGITSQRNSNRECFIVIHFRPCDAVT